MSKPRKRPNYEGHFRKRKDGRYERQITVIVQGRRSRESVYGRDHDELNENVAKLYRKLGAGWQPGTGKIAVSEMCDRWLADVLAQAREGKKSIRTYGQYEWLTRTYIVPELGRLPINRVIDERCKDVLARVRAAGKSDRTVVHTFTALHRAFRYAVQQGWISASPMEKLDKPTAAEHKVYVLTKEEAQRFIEECGREPYFDAALATCLALGMRLGEVLGIRERAVNERRRKLEIHSQAQRLPTALRTKENKDGLVIVERPKWDSDREPDLPGIALNRLQKHIKRQGLRRKAAGVNWSHTVTVMRDGRYGEFREEQNDLLFTTTEGRPVDPHVVRDAFIRVCQRAGIPWSRRGTRGLRLHDLRASASTLLIEDGATAREVMALCGWKSPQVFLHYTKVEEQARAKTATRMESILSAASA